MNCPIRSGENAEYLLDYAAGNLPAEARALTEEHLALCPACREFVTGQQAVWQALDSWEPAAVSLDFDRRLYQRVEQKVSWWTRLAQPFHPLFQHALPIAAAAGVILVAGLLLDRPAAPVASVPQSAQVETLQPDQVELALDDMEMLREFNQLVPDHAGPKM